MLDPVDDVDEKMWKLMNWCWSIEVKMRPTCGEILLEIELDASMQQFRDALPEGTQESQQLQYAIRKSSSVPIDPNRIKQILAELFGSHADVGDSFDGAPVGVNHDVPSGFKLREGGTDGVTIFGPEVKGRLSVTLMHTLMHERFVVR